MEFPPSRCSNEKEGALPVKKGPWTGAEDAILVSYVKQHGEGNWNAIQKYSGLSRCGKSCRLRWANHLRPNLKKGPIDKDEESKIIEFHAQFGNKWAKMAMQLPGRTDNEIKNFWNTRKKRMERIGKSASVSETMKPKLHHTQTMHTSSPLSSTGESESEIASNQGIKFKSFSHTVAQPNSRINPKLMELVDMSANSVVSQQNVASSGSPIPKVSRCLCNALPFVGSQTKFPETFPITPLFLGHPYLLRMESVSESFPYDPDPGDLSSICKALSNHASAFGSGTFSSTSSLDSNLMLELPSVQLSESVDSTGTPDTIGSSPFLTRQLPNTVAGDSFACGSGSLLEAALRQKISPTAPLDVADQLFVLASKNSASDSNGVCSTLQNPNGPENSDPLSILGCCCSVSPLNQELKPGCASRCDRSSCLASLIETAVKQEPTSDHAPDKVKMEITGAPEHLLDRTWAERLEDLMYFESETGGPIMEFCNAASNIVVEGLQVSGSYLNSLDFMLSCTQEEAMDPDAGPLWESSSPVWDYMPGVTAHH